MAVTSMISFCPMWFLIPQQTSHDCAPDHLRDPRKRGGHPKPPDAYTLNWTTPLTFATFFDLRKAQIQIQVKGCRKETLSLNENELPIILQRVYIQIEECRMAVIFVISLPEKLCAKGWSWECNWHVIGNVIDMSRTSIEIAVARIQWAKGARKQVQRECQVTQSVFYYKYYREALEL